MRYLIIMYVIMTLGFFWNFQWSLVVFSLTWVACLVFRRHLPQLPYPDIQVEKMYVKTRQNVTIFLCFISPALCVSLVYQMLLTFGGDDFARDWPPSRITDLLVSQNYPLVLMDNVLLDKQSTPRAGFEMVYVLTDMLRAHFFAFAFFVAHWFFFAIKNIEHKVLEGGRPIYVKSFLEFTFLKAPLVFFVEVFVYWMASCAFPNMIGAHLEKPGLGQVAVFMANHLTLLAPLLFFLWWALFSVSQSLINVVLVKVFILRRGSGKELK
ncbi:hypothetical protein V6R97_05770 [Chromohalobacter salexigens]|uniref:hypothetical protein n=1 Tax=Chromohalobacter israelensis TaxID=141390 RepID=UPI0032E8D556